LLADLSIVCPDPVAHLLADVPRGVVPDQDQGSLTQLCQFFAAPGQVLGGDWTNRAVLDEA
jgi:hypothetical protein